MAVLASAVWNAYQRAFEKQRDVAELLGASLPDVTGSFASHFSKFLDVLADIPSYFKRIP